MTTHTPGPWQAFYNDAEGFHVNSAPNGEDFDFIIAEQFANEDDATLCTAAPTMLAALEGLFENCVMIQKYWGEGSNTKQSTLAITEAYAAIAQAKGSVLTSTYN